MTAPHLSKAQIAGNLIFTSGQLGFDNNGKIIGDGVRAQTRQTLLNLVGILQAHGLGQEHIVKTTVWLTDRSNFPDFNEEYAAFFGTQKPARSTVICDLAIEGALIEIEAIAAFPVN